MVIQYLESALFEHKIVVVPDLGAFIKEEILSGNEVGYLVPTRTKLSFDTSLRHDPSILPNQIADGEGYTIAEAERELAYFVAEVKHRLAEFGKFKLDNLGELTQDGNGIIKFESGAEVNLSADSYGLPTLAVKILPLADRSSNVANHTQSESRKTNNAAQTINTATKSRGNSLVIWILVLGCVAALTAILYLLNQKKASESGKMDEEDGVVFNRKAKPSHDDEQITTLPEESNNEEIASAEPSTPSTTSPATKAPSPVVTTPTTKPSKPASQVLTEAPKATKSNIELVYNVVVGSFGNPDNAYKLSKSLTAKGFDVHVLDPKGSSKLYKVSIGQFDTEGEAKTFIKDKQSGFKDALFLLKP